jgi:hypothetical protein
MDLEHRAGQLAQTCAPLALYLALGAVRCYAGTSPMANALRTVDAAKQAAGSAGTAHFSAKCSTIMVCSVHPVMREAVYQVFAEPES